MTAGLVCPLVTLVTVSYLGCERYLVVGLLTVGVGLGGFSQSGERRRVT